MNKVVLLTDLGTASFELAHLKASMYGASKDFELIDVTNEVRAFDIVEAYFFINNLWQKYPEDSLFVLSVGVSEGKHNGYLMAQNSNRLFIAPDNGLLTMFLEEHYTQFWEVPETLSLQEAVTHILQKKDWSSVWESASSLVVRIAEQAQYDDKLIKGAIIHADRFGNLYTNISKLFFEEQVIGSRYLIRVKRDEKLEKVTDQIADVAEGDLMAYFDITGSHLVIGIKKGNASRLLGLSKGKYIFIEKLGTHDR